jgi:hypothetical protein
MTFPPWISEQKCVSGLATLLVFVHYCYKNTIQENLVCNRSLESHTTEEDIFNVIGICMNEFENQLVIVCQFLYQWSTNDARYNIKGDAKVLVPCSTHKQLLKWQSQNENLNCMMS